jgi:hypothetical protein
VAQSHFINLTNCTNHVLGQSAKIHTSHWLIFVSTHTTYGWWVVREIKGLAKQDRNKFKQDIYYPLTYIIFLSWALA